VLKFDELKMMNTGNEEFHVKATAHSDFWEKSFIILLAIQNDFSYYRRTTQRSGSGITNGNNGNEYEPVILKGTLHHIVIENQIIFVYRFPFTLRTACHSFLQMQRQCWSC